MHQDRMFAKGAGRMTINLMGGRTHSGLHAMEGGVGVEVGGQEDSPMKEMLHRLICGLGFHD